MSINALIGLIALAGLVMLVAGGGLAISNISQNRAPRPGILLAVIGLVIAVVFFAISSGLVLVGPTEVAVVFQSVGGDQTRNSLWETPLGPGVHVVIPGINTVYTYSTEVRTYTMSKTANEGQIQGDDSVAVRTQDGQQVYVDVSVLYNIDPTKANQLRIKWQDRYEADFVRPTVRSAVRDVFSGYNVEDAYGQKREEIATKIKDLVKPQFPDNGLLLDNLLLRNITFSDEFIKAVEQKQVAQQQAEQAKQEALRAVTIAGGQADAARTAAKGDADANATRADGEAKAIIARAQADAQALSLINEQISKNPQLIEWRYIEKLGQDVRLILLPSNSPFLFDLQSLTNQTITTTKATPVPTAVPTTAPGK